MVLSGEGIEPTSTASRVIMALTHFDVLARGDVSFSDDSLIWNAQESDEYQTLWSITLDEKGDMLSSVSNLGSDEFPSNSLAVCKKLCIPGKQRFRERSTALENGSSGPIQISTISVTADLISGMSSLPTATFVPAPCGDQLVFNRGKKPKELRFTDVSTRFAQCFNEQAHSRGLWLQRLKIGTVTKP